MGTWDIFTIFTTFSSIVVHLCKYRLWLESVIFILGRNRLELETIKYFLYLYQSVNQYHISNRKVNFDNWLTYAWFQLPNYVRCLKKLLQMISSQACNLLSKTWMEFIFIYMCMLPNLSPNNVSLYPNCLLN